jgi:hypothetical protein
LSTEVADFVDRVASSVPLELALFRFEVARLLLAAVLHRLGASEEEVSGLLGGFSLQSMSAEHARLLDGCNAGRWFLEAVERSEPEVRDLLGGRLAAGWDGPLSGEAGDFPS